MALVLKDRVKETTTTASTGTLTLAGAVAGFDSFSVVGNANTTYYAIVAQTPGQWEVGIGTYTAAGTLLARTTVLANSAGTQPSALSFSAGTKDVFVTYPASYSFGTAQILAIANGGTGNTTLAGASIATYAGTETLTNKRINSRVSATTSAASITPDVASFDQYVLTAQAVNLAINAPTGTPVDGTKLIFRVLDNGVTRTLTWNATFTVIGVTLPTATTANKMIYVGCIYNAANTRWDVIAVTTQA